MKVLNPPATSHNSLAPSLNCIGFRTRIKFDQCLKQDKVIFNPNIAVIIYIVYGVNLWLILC